MDSTPNDRPIPEILDTPSHTPEMDTTPPHMRPLIDPDQSVESRSDTSDRSRSESENKGLRPDALNSSPYVQRSRAKSESRWNGAQQFTPLDSALRKVLALFNKLTQANFQKITSQLLQLLQTNQKLGLELLRGTVTIIFDKAVAEAFFADIYSQMCQTISLDVNDLFIPYYAEEFKAKNQASALEARAEAQKLSRIAETEPTAENRTKASQAETAACKAEENAQKSLDDKKSKNVFKGILLTECQKEFERGACVISDDSLAAHEISVLQSAQKRRMLGNIRFIGELYKKGLVIELIIYACIEHLIKNPSEEEIEVLCNLMQTVGGDLDAGPRGRAFLNAKFLQIETLTSTTLTARIRFMLLDLKDLRKNKWKLRTNLVST